MKLKKILLWEAIIILCFFTSPIIALSGPNEVTVAMYGGTFADNTKKCYVEPFEKKYNAKVNVVIGASTDQLAKLRAQKNDPQLDVAYMDWDIAVQARSEGLIDKLDRQKIPNIAVVHDILLDKEGYLLGHFFSATGIAYNTKYVKDPPKSWKDIWDPKYKGKIALSDITGTAGYHSLIMISKAFGGDINNLSPGFEALKKLKGGIVTFFHHPDMLISLVERGEVWIATWYADRTGAAYSKGVPIAFAFPQEGAVGIRGCFTIAKGCKNKDLAEKYINMALTPECQKCFAESQSVGPANKNVKIDPEIAKNLVYGRERIEKLYFPDSKYVSEHRGEWTERWNKEITK